MKNISLKIVPHPQHLKLGVKEMTLGENRNLNLHDHTLDEIAIVLSSSQTIHRAEGHQQRIERGDVLLIRQGQAHAYENTSGFSVINFLYDPKTLPLPQLDGSNLSLYKELFSPNITRENPALPIARLNEESLKELKEISTPLLKELKSNQPGKSLRAFGLFISAIITICRAGSQNNTLVPDNPALPALHYINLHYKEKISIEKLVSITKLSRNTLFRRFKDLTGYTPIDYQLNKKLDTAKELVKNSKLTIEEIAFNCGFFDSNHMIRLFTSKYKTTPGKLRKKII